MIYKTCPFKVAMEMLHKIHGHIESVNCSEYCMWFVENKCAIANISKIINEKKED